MFHNRFPIHNNDPDDTERGDDSNFRGFGFDGGSKRVGHFDGYENDRLHLNFATGQFRRKEKMFRPNQLATSIYGGRKHGMKRRWNKWKYVTKAQAFIFEFLEGASIHGFVYLAKIGLHIIERVLWLMCICIAFYGIVSLSQRTWERYQTSPMVISMDRNKFFWNTSFPSLTVCPRKRIDDHKLQAYIEANPALFQDEADKSDFRNFIVKLANSSFDSFQELPMNKTFGIPSSKYLQLLYDLKWNFEPEISTGTLTKMYIDETITELGICYSVNSMIARYNSYNYWRNNQWNLIKHQEKVTVHPLDGEIYAQIINLSTSYDVYFHGAMEVSDIAKQRYTFPESDYSTVELVALDIFASDAAREFTITQRGCRFPHEVHDMKSSPIYTLGLCRRECRMQHALRACKCVPHFYRNRLKGGKVLPICDFDGLKCLAVIKNEIISLKSDTRKIDCNCLANCDDSNFFVQSLRSRVWFLGANLQWGINDYPKMQLKRDVLFSFADVLVYIGGLAGFFLGCSLLSITELIYYLTARFIKRLMAK